MPPRISLPFACRRRQRESTFRFWARNVILIQGVAAAVFFTVRTSASEFLIFQKQERKVLPKVIINQREYLPVIDFLYILDLPYSESVSAGYFQMTLGRNQIRLNKDSPQAVVNGTAVALSAPVVIDRNQWLVPPDFIERALNRILAEKIAVSVSGDRFSVGGTNFRRLSIKPVAAEQTTRIAVQLSAPTDAEIRQEESRIILSFGSALVETGNEEIGYEDERVRSIRFQQTATLNQLVIEMADKNLVPRLSQLASQNVYLVEVSRPDSTSEASGETGALTAVIRDPHRWQHITVDAGHGGEDRGAVIDGNLAEKDVALAIARRVRWALQSKLGVQVVLTRTEDQFLTLEDRVVAANQARSNLFVSIHIGNAAPAQSSRSYAYVFRAANPALVADSRPIDVRGLFVPWEQAQLNSLTSSQRLAECVQTELNRALNNGDASIGYREAPLKLLSSLAMPAILLEVGNASHRDFRERANDPQFQNLVAATVVAGVQKFRAIHERP